MSVYDLDSVNLPVLTGTGLKLFAAALGNDAIRSLLVGRLLRDAGIPRLRALSPSEAPTFEPLVRSQDAGDARPDIGPIGDDALSAQRPSFAPSVTDYARAYRAGATTPEAVADRFLEAVKQSEAGDRPLRAMIAINQADLMEQARAATARLEAGEPLSVFDGVPVTIKDELDQTPYPTTVGTAFLGTSPAREDATLVARLRAGGALLLGKANMHEIGINPNGHNVHHGMTRNPYDLRYDPGGSSSGSAASVAAGLCPVSIGADGGGSIRIPAAFCGVVGLKATYGRYSEHGVAPLCWSVGHVGPITANVEDLALTYALTAGADAADPLTAGQPPPTIEGWDTGDLKGVRIGVFREWFRHASVDIVKHCEDLLDGLVAAGGELVEITIPGLDAMRIAHAVSILTEMATSMGNHASHFEEFGAAVRISLTIGNMFSASDYVTAQRVRTRAMATFDGVFNDVDVILTPATAITSPQVREDHLVGGWSDLTSTSEIMRYVIPGNFVGLPGISFPAGYDKAGLPIGMQAYGRHWDEALLLRVARVAEGLVKRRRPAMFFDLLNGDHPGG